MDGIVAVLDAVSSSGQHWIARRSVWGKRPTAARWPDPGDAGEQRNRGPACAAAYRRSSRLAGPAFLPCPPRGIIAAGAG